jgi:NAD(P)-dependent dehydrogenase (short-subunit alcohol dehydrogenase family)
VLSLHACWSVQHLPGSSWKLQGGLQPSPAFVADIFRCCVLPLCSVSLARLPVNISSSTAYLAVPQASAYSASKFAVRGYSDALRIELAPFGVHVMHVAPGQQW